MPCVLRIAGIGLSGLRRAYLAGFREVERVDRAIGLVQRLITRPCQLGLLPTGPYSLASIPSMAGRYIDLLNICVAFGDFLGGLQPLHITRF